MTDTTIFAFAFARADDDDVNIRTVILDGEPWFFGTDVLQALNIAKGSTTDTYARIAADRKRYAGQTSLGLPGGRPVVLLNEAGLYDCVIRSDKPEARQFQSWVTGEVLPSISKTGKYALADHGREAMPLPMDIAEELSWLQQRRSLLGSIIRADIYKCEASEIPPWGGASVILEVTQGLRGMSFTFHAPDLLPPRCARGSCHPPAVVALLHRCPRRVDATGTFLRDTLSVPNGLTWRF